MRCDRWGEWGVSLALVLDEHLTLGGELLDEEAHAVYIRPLHLEARARVAVEIAQLLNVARRQHVPLQVARRLLDMRE